MPNSKGAIWPVFYVRLRLAIVFAGQLPGERGIQSSIDTDDESNVFVNAELVRISRYG
jgi:hypothetical protein